MNLVALRCVALRCVALLASRQVYYKEAVGAIVVYDVNRAPTFDAVKKWKSDIDNKVHPSIIATWATPC